MATTTPSIPVVVPDEIDLDDELDGWGPVRVRRSVSPQGQTAAYSHEPGPVEACANDTTLQLTKPA